MKPITVCFSYILAFSCAGNTALASQPHCGSFRVQQYHAPKAVAVYQPYQVFAAVGYSTQVEAEVARAQKPLVAELQGLRSEIAALRGEQRTAFGNLFKFRGTGSIIFEGGGDTDPNPRPVDPGPGPGPGPQPSADRGPVLTDGVKALLTNNCSVCHDGQKQEAFTLDANGTLEANRSVEIWARVLSAKPGVMMPPQGSNEEMRNVVNDWYANASQRSLESEILSRKGTK